MTGRIDHEWYQPITNYKNGCRCDDCRAAKAAQSRRLVRWRWLAGLAPDDPRHGSASTYTHYRCACDACRAAWAVYFAGLRASQKPLAADDPRHGTENGYTNYRCRCDACRVAQREVRARRRAAS